MAARPLPETADLVRRVRRAVAGARAAAAERRAEAEPQASTAWLAAAPQRDREPERRREHVAAAETEGHAVLDGFVSPLCKKVAAVLAAEGHPFEVSTPVGAVRLSRGATREEFVEIVLDTSRNPPALVGRATWVWGRRVRQVAEQRPGRRRRGRADRVWGQGVRQEERVVAEHPDIGRLAADQLLDYLLEAIAPLVER